MSPPAHPHYGTPLRRATAPTLRNTPAVQAEARGRLTSRDRWILLMLAEHHVLTTDHIAQLAFTSRRSAEHRLLTLHRLRVVDRFRPYTTRGSAPHHYTLATTGHALLAEHRTDLPPRRPMQDIAYSPTLAHTIGVNAFFTALGAHARRTPGARLDVWWPEHRCTTAWGSIARPDGYGAFTEHGRSITFFLEHDTGTEPLHRLTDKLSRYRTLTTATGITTPVLFWLPNPTREHHLHHALAGNGVPPVPVATAHPTPDGPAAAVWRTPGDPRRHRLVQLPTNRSAEQVRA